MHYTSRAMNIEHAVSDTHNLTVIVSTTHDDSTQVEKFCTFLQSKNQFINLQFSDCTFSSKSINLILTSIITSTTIKSLTWRFQANLDDQNVALIAELIKQNTVLSQISLGGDRLIRVDDFGLIPIALTCNNYLSYVSFFNLTTTSKQINLLAEAVIANPNVAKFCLSNCNLNTENFKFIADKIRSNTTLQDLYLAYNKCKPSIDDLKYITYGLSTNCSLTGITMTNNFPTEDLDCMAQSIAINNTNMVKILPCNPKTASMVQARRERINGYCLITEHNSSKALEKHTPMQIFFSCFLGTTILKAICKDPNINKLLGFGFSRIPELRELYCSCVDIPTDVINELIRAWMYREYKNELSTQELI